VLSSKQRGFLHRLVNSALDEIEALPMARKVRWSLDIDPIDLL
jgi:primosomal protein N' (replication factor Y)